MKRENLERAIADAVRDADLRPEQIPSIDLYLDQVMSLMEEKRLESSDCFADRVMTKTMVNNYSKDGLISPVKGKKYSREQILQMLLVYHMKNTLSIGEIKQALQSVYALQDYDGKRLEGIYARFLTVKDGQREQTDTLVRALAEQEQLNPEDDCDLFLLILGLSSLSSYLKNTAQVLLADWCAELASDAEEREKERRDEQKRQKQEKKAAKAAKKTEPTDATEASTADAAREDGEV